LDLIVWQEMLGSISNEVLILGGLILGWSFHAIDARCQSSGMVMGFNLKSINVVSVYVYEGVMDANIF